MKKLIILVLLLAYPAHAQVISGQFSGILGQSAGGGGSCSATPLIDFETYSSGGQVGNDDAHYYGGNGVAITGTKCICKVSFSLYAHGTITSKSYTAKIWTLSGNNLNTLLGTSDAVTGSSWSHVFVDFSFPTCVSVSDATVAVTLDQGGTDGTNFVDMDYATSNGYTGSYDRWNSAKTSQAANASQDRELKLYVTE